MPPLLQLVTYLSPPKGPALVLTDNETWLGRNSFELSKKAQLLCSRRQACLKITNTAVTLECHGLNPIYFVACHSVNFHASADTPPSRLHQLRKGEIVELVDGDKFFLAPKECLLAVRIKPFKPENDEAVQPTPDDVHLNSRDDRSPDQACSPKATQLGLALTDSLVEEHRPPQTNVLARSSSAEVCVNLADRCFTREICMHKSPAHKYPVFPCNESCNAVGSSPTGLTGSSVNDITVLQVDFSKSATNGEPTREVLTPMRGSIEVSSIGVSDVHHGPQFRLDSSGVDLLDMNEGDLAAAGGSAAVRGGGSGNAASEGCLVRSIPDTSNCGLDSSGPSEIVVNSNLDCQEASQSIGCVSGRAPAPTQDVLKSTQKCTLSARSSPEGRNIGSSGDTTVEILVHPETFDYHLESRGLSEVVVTSQGDARGAREKICTPDILGCTSSPLRPELNQVEDNCTSAVLSGLNNPQSPLLCHQRCSTVISVLSEKATASTSETLPGTHNAVEVLETSLRQGHPEPDGSQPKLVPSSRHQSLVGGYSGSPVTSHECRVLPASQPLVVDLTRSENVRNSQEAQLQSQIAHVEQTMGNDCGVGPIEGMENVVVTISGYEDMLRAKLINLISTIGASYTGSLTKMNTHVVCWKFRGAKYEMAKKLGKCIINHCWFEDCQKAGVRLSEAPYSSASGEMAVPLRWDQSSSTQHPYSTASGFYQDQDYNSRLPAEQSLPAIVIGGPSSHSVKGKEQSGPSASSSRGKGLVDLNSSANRLQGGNVGPLTDECQDTPQIRTQPRNGVSRALDLSTHHHGEVQESDEFWNAVIREFDDTTNQVTESSCHVGSEANHRTALMEHRTGRTSRGTSPTPGSSSRGLDLEFHEEIRSERRNAVAFEAESSRAAEVDILQEAKQSHALVGDQPDNVQSEVDHTPSYPEVIQRKRKHAFAIAKINYRKWKYRRLMRSSEALRISGNSPCQEGSMVGLIRDVTSGGEPALDSRIVQERASTANMEVDVEQRVGLNRAGSVGEPDKKSGESSISNEIVCVICHSDTKPVIEGVLACGHQFCYPCIQRWADEAKLKSPTCPLCKLPFDFITFRELGKAAEDGDSAVLEERIVQIGLQLPQETLFTNLPSLRTENLCVTCGSRDTPELLLTCTNCRQRAIHTFCLDPPRPPGSSWFCTRCSQLLSRMQTREAYGRLFQGSSQQLSGLRRVDMGMNLAPPSQTSNRAGVVATFQSSATPLGTSLAPQSGATTRAGGLAAGLSSGTPSRRGRQNSLYNFLVRQNDV